MGKKDKEKDLKTNVSRLLDAAKLPYEMFSFEVGDTVPSGVEAAALLGIDCKVMYKTLVTTGKTGTHYVFMIPVAEELNLKKAAEAVGEKSIEMLKSKDLLGLTGYVHGGCSPIGMKKPFRTTVDSSAEAFDTIYFSAGKIGYQVKMSPRNLEKMVPISYTSLC